MPPSSGAFPAFDRADVLDKAARLLRRGDLEAAIREYVRLFDANPRDLTVGNTLGDLYLRTGANDKAAAQFMTLAAQLVTDGFEAKARALYKKVLRVQPHHAAAQERIDELESKQATRTSPFLQRVLETASAAREAAAAHAAQAAQAAQAAHAAERAYAPAPAGVGTGHGEVDEIDVSRAAHEESVCPIRIVPPAERPSPPLPPPPHLTVDLGLSLAPAPEPDEREKETGPELQAEVEVDVEVEVEAEAEAEAEADEWTTVDLSAAAPTEPAGAVGQRGEIAPVVSERTPAARELSDAVAAIDRALEAPRDEAADALSDRILALERAIDAGVDAGDETRVLAAQLELGRACLTAGLGDRARNIAEDLLARQPDVAEYVQLSEAVSAAPASPASARHVREPQPRPTPPPPRPAGAAPHAEGPHQPHAEHAAAHAPDELLTEWMDAERVFESLRTTVLQEADAAADALVDEAERAAAVNDFDKAAAALEEAMCTPRLRGAAGSRLAHLLLDSGAPIEALACLEWVAEAPPTTDEGAHELAYDLAVTLEALGEHAQALGVYRELLAEAGPTYRDVATRAERLAAA